MHVLFHRLLLTLKGREKEKFCLMCVLEDHANLVLKSDSSGSYFPSKIFYHLKSIGDFIHFQQEDAHDFAVTLTLILSSSVQYAWNFAKKFSQNIPANR